MSTWVAVFAHPDDETFICGGTLARAAAEGHRVVLVCATKGEMGRRLGVPPAATRESLPVLREQELQRACKALGVEELIWLGYRDKTLEMLPPDELTEAVLAHLKRERPDVVVTFHERLGGHPDHCAIGAAATCAFAEYAKTRESAQLYFVAWSNMAKEPASVGLSAEDFVEVNVDDYLQAKLKAYRAHRTQSQLMGWLWKNDAQSRRRLAHREYLIRGDRGTLRQHKGLFA